ncbi:MAG: D-alanyl-D-alanine carboxypeptidase [Streptosporangiales bacterium]|nr:D-alanyl-D-alanine carboxypeptidase [Streptosporangiales bacterium]
MGRRVRGLAVLLTAVPVVVASSPGHAEPTPDRAVGGALLARDGIVVHDAPGVRDLPKVSASSYVIADLDTGDVLAAKDAHGHYRPASTIKILTAITLIPRLDADDKVRPTQKDCNVDGSKVGLTPKMKYPVDDLFRGLMMASGNDAALALSRAAGGKEHTLKLMNATAHRLQAYDTVTKTPNGLDRKGQHSSAYDLALFARHGLDMPEFRDYVTTERAKFPAPKKKSYQIETHNRLLRPGPDRYKGAIGVKNGWTSKANASFVGAATRKDHTIVVALMHSEPYFWKDARQLLSWGFAARDKVRPVGMLAEPLPTTSPTPAPSPSTASPRASAAGGASSDTRGSGGPLPLLALGLAGAVALGAGGVGLLLLIRRRRAPSP